MFITGERREKGAAGEGGEREGDGGCEGGASTCVCN